MKLSKLYELVVNHGINADPRGKAIVARQLKETKKAYGKLKKYKKDAFDKECFTNPYADTRILYGDKNSQIKRILLGIDIDTSELLLADRLNSAGKRIDLVVSHHPNGYALAGLPDVMRLQIDLLVKAGIDKDVAVDFMNKRIKEVERRVMPSNQNKTVDAARILNIPFMCIHTCADNHACQYIQAVMDKEKPGNLESVLNILRKIPEYKDAIKYKAGPNILIGDAKKKSGKIMVDMTGGTEGTKDLFGRLAQAGVGTIIGMHLSEEHFKKIQAEHMNVVIAGHISSDTLGLNLLFDKIEKTDKLEFICCSGFRRFRR